MAKSKILIQLVNNEIALDVALKRLMLICGDLNYEEIYTWAEKELDGYSKDDKIPEYRNLGIGHIVFSGLRGNFYNHIKYTEASMPIHWFPNECKELIVQNFDRSPIQNIIEKSKSSHIFSRDLTDLASYIKVDIAFSSIIQKIDAFSFGEIANKVSNILFKIFKKLDSEYGNLDSLDIDISNKEKNEMINIEKVLLSYVNEMKYIQMGDNNEIKDSNIGEGNEN